MNGAGCSYNEALNRGTQRAKNLVSKEQQLSVI